jgi:dTDP-4-dehydrorhamnose 3,5-epimerase
MIDGVKVKQLKAISDERGRLMEMLRADDEIFEKFGQAYMTTVYSGVVKGWHYHKKQLDNFVCVKGMIKLVLYDGREKSTSSFSGNTARYSYRYRKMFTTALRVFPRSRP